MMERLLRLPPEALDRDSLQSGDSRPHWIVASAIMIAYAGGQLALVAACKEWDALHAADSGLWFDLLLTCGVALLATTLALLPLCRARRSLVLHLLCWTPIAVLFTVRVIDAVLYYESGLHLNLMARNHSQRDALRLMLAAIPLAQLILPLLALAFVYALGRFGYASVGVVVLSWRRLLTASVLALTLIYGLAAQVAVPSVEYATAGPEWTTYRAWSRAARERSCRKDPACAAQMNQLAETIRRKLTRFGMRVDPGAELPLRKPLAYHGALPFPTPQRSERLNVLLIFMESMSAYFVNSYNPRTPSMTPELDKFGAEAMRVENYYNATTPTVTSLAAALCSIHPPSGHDEFGPAFFGALHCLSDTLAPRGYESTFIRGIGREFANTGPFLESQGFKVLDMTDIRAELREETESWGYSDHQLFRYLQTVLEQKRAETPFVLGMTTVDLHPPFDLTPVPEVLEGEEGRILNIVHNTDHAFGQFYRWFSQSRFAENTILVVTADHAVLPTPEYVKLRGDSWEKSFYDHIPLFIRVPGVELPRVWKPEVANSVDLLPTILHLLGVNEPNPFEGVSLFDDRRSKRSVLGDHAYLLYSNQLTRSGKRVVDNFNIADCVQGAMPPTHTELLTRCEQQSWHEWKARLIDQKRIWPR